MPSSSARTPVLLVLACLVVGLVPSGCTGSGRADDEDGAAGEAGVERAAPWPADPPDGYRWVGDRGVVVAVPERWTRGGTSCLLPVEETVYVETGAIADCAASAPAGIHRRVSSLAVVPSAERHFGVGGVDLEPLGEVAGERVLVGEECDWFGRSACRTLLAVPARDVMFALHVADPVDVDAAVVQASLRLLPEGWTAVPLGDRWGGTPMWGAPRHTVRGFVRLLERRGLSVRVLPVAVRRPVGVEPLPEGSLLRIRPVPGTPVEDDAVVTVAVVAATVGRARPD